MKEINKQPENIPLLPNDDEYGSLGPIRRSPPPRPSPRATTTNTELQQPSQSTIEYGDEYGTIGSKKPEETDSLLV